MTQSPEPPMGGNYPPPPSGGQGADHPQGTTILVLGILGLVVCAPLGVAAWVMGNKALPEAQAMGAPNAGMIKAGRICGMIASILMILGIVLVFIIIAAGGLASATT